MPSSANCKAIALPIPLLAPVTIAIGILMDVTMLVRFESDVESLLPHSFCENVCTVTTVSMYICTYPFPLPPSLGVFGYGRYVEPPHEALIALQNTP